MRYPLNGTDKGFYEVLSDEGLHLAMDRLAEEESILMSKHATELKVHAEKTQMLADEMRKRGY